jgi:hypothetical protein
VDVESMMNQWQAHNDIENKKCMNPECTSDPDVDPVFETWRQYIPGRGWVYQMHRRLCEACASVDDYRLNPNKNDVSNISTQCKSCKQTGLSQRNAHWSVCKPGRHAIEWVWIPGVYCNRCCAQQGLMDESMAKEMANCARIDLHRGDTSYSDLWRRHHRRQSGSDSEQESD